MATCHHQDIELGHGTKQSTQQPEMTAADEDDCFTRVPPPEELYEQFDSDCCKCRCIVAKSTTEGCLMVTLITTSFIAAGLVTWMVLAFQSD